MEKSVIVDIKDIVINKDYMIRESLDKKTVEAYKENLTAILEASPIVVFETPNGLLLVDGFHRHAAARQLNWEQINVIKMKGSMQDAFAFACLANLKHGRPLSPSEKKKAIQEYIKLNVELSDRMIAEDTCSIPMTIGRYRKELEDAGIIKSPEKRLGADGKERTTVTFVTVETPETIPVDPFVEWFNSHIINGDVFDVLPNDSLKYDLIIADPPYGILDEKWDKKDKFELLNFTRRWLNLVLQKLKPTGRLFIFWSREYLFELKSLVDEIKNEYPLNFGGLIVWNFRNTLSIPNNRKELKITWEPIFYFYGLDAGELNRPDTELTGEKWTNETDADVWNFAVPQSNFTDKKTHPAQKPLDLYKHIIKLSTKTNDLILDPFAGSGTTGHAAYELGRDFKLVESDPQYVEMIRARLKGVFQNEAT